MENSCAGPWKFPCGLVVMKKRKATPVDYRPKGAFSMNSQRSDVDSGVKRYIYVCEAL